MNIIPSKGLTEHIELPVERTGENATLPTYGSEHSAGMDLYANFADFEPGQPFGTNLRPGERRLIHTGISMAIPASHYGRIAPRSGLAYKKGIDVLAGVIDADYRGDIGVILINLGHDPVGVAHGDRIAQLIIEPYRRAVILERYLDDTERGSGGWGSTGR